MRCQQRSNLTPGFGFFFLLTVAPVLTSTSDFRFEDYSLDPPSTNETFCPGLTQIPGFQYYCVSNPDCESPQKAGSMVFLTCQRPFFRPVDLKAVPPWATCQPNGTWSRILSAKDRNCTWDCGAFDQDFLPAVAEAIIEVVGYIRSHLWGGNLVWTDRQRAQWPWHATLYQRDSRDNRWKVECGGTLIAPNVVLTAAHCVVQKGLNTTLLKTNEIQVFFGRYQSDYNKTDKHTQTIPGILCVTCLKIKRIEKEDTYDPKFKQADIAVIILERPVHLTTFVRPACIPTKIDLTEMTLEDARPGGAIVGTTVGFGIDETFHISKYLRRLDAPVVSAGECKRFLERELKLFHSVPSNIICSGRPKDRAAVCKGDSGGGLVLWQGDSQDKVSRYFVHGVVSHGPPEYKPRNVSDPCDTWSYKIFTKVVSYSWWIQKIVEKNVVDWPIHVLALPDSAPLSQSHGEVPTEVGNNPEENETSEEDFGLISPSWFGDERKTLLKCPPTKDISPCRCDVKNGGSLTCDGRDHAVGFVVIMPPKSVDNALSRFMEENYKLATFKFLSLRHLRISATTMTTLNLPGLLSPHGKIYMDIENLTVSYNKKLEHLVPAVLGSGFSLNVAHLHLEGNPRMTRDQESLSAALTSLFNTSSLQSLSLANNRLETFSASAFYPLLRPRSDQNFQNLALDLAQNPLICDRNLTWLANIWLGYGERPYCANYPRQRIGSFNFPLSIRGTICTSACSSCGENYYWCYVNRASKSWDYCSLPENDLYGQECQRPCELYNNSRIQRPYYFCKLEEGWGYCSPDSTLATNPESADNYKQLTIVIVISTSGAILILLGAGIATFIFAKRRKIHENRGKTRSDNDALKDNEQIHLSHLEPEPRALGSTTAQMPSPTLNSH